MIYICPECGSEIPTDSQFCYSCGRKKDNSIRLDDSGRFIPPEMNKCASCGTDTSQSEMFCGNCGEPISRTQMAAFRPKMAKYAWIGLALALIPGALGFLPWIGLISIFGLGHLYFRKWGRAVTYFCMSALMFYFESQINMDVWWTSLIFFTFLIFIYIIQLMEVLVLSFIPPKDQSESL